MTRATKSKARHDRARRLEIYQVIREGGGTAPAELGVARQLRARGHHVRLAGPPDAARRVREAGFPFDPLLLPPAPPGAPPGLLPALLAAARPWAEAVACRLDRARADVVVSDSLLFGAIAAAISRRIPTAVLVPTVYPVRPAQPAAGGSSYAGRPEWRSGLPAVNRARAALGLPPVASVTEHLLQADRVLVLSSRAFELPEVTPPPHVIYTGPQLDPASSPGLWRQPWDDTGMPLVLVSLSTTDQGQQALLDRLLAAIGSLPVRALVTLGPAIDASRFRPSPNVVLERFVPHAAVLPQAALVVTHAGHGTVMAALSAGVPLVCVPMGRDQPDVARRAERHGTAVSVPDDASAAALRTAIETVLGNPSYRQSAQQMARAIAREDHDRAADEVEALSDRSDQRHAAGA